MSTADSNIGKETRETSPRFRLRPHRVTLPVDPTDEELARDWSLSQEDKNEVSCCRGDDNRRRFAIQLCALRKFGNFIEEYSTVPVRIINHLSRQLELSPVLFIGEPERGATESEYLSRLRQYLGYKSFDQNLQTQLTKWLESLAAEGVLPNDLLRRAEEQLRVWHIIPPASSTLERMVTSVAAYAQQEVFESIAQRLTPQTVQSIEELLQTKSGEQKSILFRLKEYPPEASAKAIRRYIDRFEQVNELVEGKIALGDINPELVQHLSALAKRYDAQSLRRFSSDKRNALIACFLSEIEKTLLDHVVEMNDQFLTTMCRHARRDYEENHRHFRRKAKEGVDVLLSAMDILLMPEQSRDEAFALLYRHIGEDRLQEAVNNCKEFKRLEERGYLDELCARYTNLRKYSPHF